MSETEHIEAMVKDMAERAEEVADRSAAIETITRESIIADNKKFRRRNAVLVILLSAQLVLSSIMVAREVFVVSPQRDEIEAIAQTLEECTTPGPRTPTAEDPTTGHDCYDRGQQSQAKAIAEIVDANHNGEIDSQEVLDAIKRFEVFLGDESG